MSASWKVFTRREIMWGGHSIWIMREDTGGRSYIRKFEMQTIEEWQQAPDDSQPLPHDQTEDFIRAVMDAGWEMGLRPTGHEDHDNELKATRYHLEDMRKLAKVAKND